MQDVTRACLMRRLVVTPMPYTHRHTRTITCMSMVQYTHTPASQGDSQTILCRNSYTAYLFSMEVEGLCAV